ncbi:MAG: hypothetical protein IT183_08780 [Acidobacteria bacterium]|nr:hypothetical protein [Acidobacteriota bacterium]
MSFRIQTPVCMVAASALALLVAATPGAQTSQRYALESTAGLRANNVQLEATVHQGRRGVRVTMADEVRDRFAAMTPEARDRETKVGAVVDFLAVVEGTSFGNGTIEVELAGAPQTGVFEGARGFVGLAFRVQSDMSTYDAFYLRPTNARADDQVRRNHSAQYISLPAWTWFLLRSETPEKYESYVDLVPDEWTRVKVEVRGSQARLFVHGQPQPTLVVNDLKTGPDARGAVALWIDLGTRAHFRNLTVTPDPGR